MAIPVWLYCCNSSSLLSIKAFSQCRRLTYNLIYLELIVLIARVRRLQPLEGLTSVSLLEIALTKTRMILFMHVKSQNHNCFINTTLLIHDYTNKLILWHTVTASLKKKVCLRLLLVNHHSWHCNLN